jgi:hypothetical protein
MVKPLRKTVWFLKKIKELPHDPVIPLLRLQSKRNELRVSKRPMLISSNSQKVEAVYINI